MKKPILLMAMTLFGWGADLPAQGLKYNVNPESAVLKDSLKAEISKTPVDFSSVKPGMEYSLNAKGYEPMFMKFTKGKSGVSFPENLSVCTPCLMELGGSPFEEGIEKSAKLKLRRKLPERRQNIMVGVLSPVVAMPSDKVVAVINGKKIKISNDDIHLTMGYPQNLTHPLVLGLNNSYIDAYDAVEKKPDPTRFYMAKVIIRPLIKKLEYRLDGKLLRDYTGPASLTCEWQFCYTSDTSKTLGSISTETAIYRTSGDYDLPVHLLIFEAARDLGAVDTLFAYLDRLEKEYMMKAVSKPSTVARIPEKEHVSQKDMLKKVSEAVVTIENDEGFGSGIMIDPAGIILTNHHVIIDDTAGLMVRLNGKEELLPAHVKILNPDFDLALIEVQAGNYEAISLSKKDSLEVGDIVYAIGTPIDKSLGQSVTKGIVSGFRKFNGVNFIQTDVSINSGNSGGALISESGRLMGIATMKAAGKGIEGLGFCIPSATIEQALQLKYK